MTEEGRFEAGAKPEITKAVARGDLPSVRKIVETAAAVSRDEKIKTINRARKWHEISLAYECEDNPAGSMEWFDVTPLTTAAMRGHDDIVEYLLSQGADPTLKGCPKSDICELSNGGGGGDDDDEPLIDRPGLHMNAFDAANGLSRKIRCCRRTRDILMAVKPYWKRSVYSGSSATRHKRTVFSNLPLGPDSQGKDGSRLHWILDVLEQVPRLQDYPLRPKDFNESLTNSSYCKKRNRVDDDQNAIAIGNKKQATLPSKESAIEYGRAPGR